MIEKQIMSGRKHILVVDDTATSAHVLATVLKHAGHEVTVARNGQIAHRMAEEHQFDLVITDEQMPTMSGCELCRRLRTQENYREVPFILFTSKSRTTSFDLVKKELDLAAVIYKEYRKSKIIEAIESALRSRPMSEQKSSREERQEGFSQGTPMEVL